MQEADVLIVGAGSAGLTLALLLARAKQPLKITVLEQGPAPEPQAPTLQRVSALNLASERLLQKLDIWSRLRSVAPYQQMQVWEADSFARIEFAAEDTGLACLGSLVDNEELRQALYQALQAEPSVQLQFGQAIVGINAGERQNLVTTANGNAYLAKLLVGADGANSSVRQQLKMPQRFWDYDHHAVVALLTTAEPHGGCARQIFLPTGPLALLPMADPHLVSIVWSTSPEHACELLALDPELFGQKVTAASQSVLGLMRRQSDASAHPLRMRYSTRWIEQQAVLVADAAHTIHPLAGQGMNLGLMDVAALAELIIANCVDGQLQVERRWLRQYERWRKAEAEQMVWLMEAFKRGFMWQHPLVKLVRAVGMRAADQLGPLKQQLMASALGNRMDLPLMAQPTVTEYS